MVLRSSSESLSAGGGLRAAGRGELLGQFLQDPPQQVRQLVPQRLEQPGRLASREQESQLLQLRLLLGRPAMRPSHRRCLLRVLPLAPLLPLVLVLEQVPVPLQPRPGVL